MKRIISAAIVGLLSAVLMISFASCEPGSGTIADTTITGTTAIGTNIQTTAPTGNGTTNNVTTEFNDTTIPMTTVG